MNYIFYFLIVISILVGAYTGRLPEVVNSVLSGADKSVRIAFSLIGIMAFWLGMMRIAERSGLVELLSRAIKPVTSRLFRDIPPNDAAIGDIAMSFSANALGLTNAATPIGIRAMENLQRHNVDKSSASNAMCLFLGMNTASFQLVPAAVIGILAGVGYSNPTEIIAPTLVVTSTVFITAIALSKLFERFYPVQGAAVSGSSAESLTSLESSSVVSFEQVESVNGEDSQSDKNGENDENSQGEGVNGIS